MVKIGDMDMSDLAWLAGQMSLRPSTHLTAAHNTERVRSFMESHLGCTAKEVACGLDLTYGQAVRAYRKIRSEWGAKESA